MLAYKKLLVLQDSAEILEMISPSYATSWMCVDGVWYLEADVESMRRSSGGIYVVKDPDSSELRGYRGALVELWVSGLVIEHTRGYRAQRATVLRLLTPGTDVGDLPPLLREVVVRKWPCNFVAWDVPSMSMAEICARMCVESVGPSRTSSGIEMLSLRFLEAVMRGTRRVARLSTADIGYYLAGGNPSHSCDNSAKTLYDVMFVLRDLLRGWDVDMCILYPRTSVYIACVFVLQDDVVALEYSNKDGWVPAAVFNIT
jgi:hypothetical protein